MVAIAILQKKNYHEVQTPRYRCLSIYFYFLFLHPVGKDKLHRVKKHYIKNGLEPSVHKNMKCTPKHAAQYSAKIHVVMFLQTYVH